MSYDYIRRAYGVSPTVGQAITIDGKPAIIVRPVGDPHYLRVRINGHRHTSNAHPTWRVDYTPARPANVCESCGRATIRGHCEACAGDRAAGEEFADRHGMPWEAS